MRDKKIIYLGFAALLIFWVIETIIHVSIFKEGSFLDQLIRPETHELWMRSIILVIIFILFFYIHAFYRLRESKRLLAEAVKTTEEEKAKTEAIIAGIGDGIVVTDRDYKIIYQNEIQTKMFGNRNGEYCHRVFEGRDDVCESCPVKLSFIDGNVHKDERCIETEHGTMHIELTSSPLRDTDGKIVAGIMVIRDISVRKKYEEDIKKYQNHLEELVQERTLELQASNELLVEEINERRETQEKYHSLFENMLNGFAYHKIIVDEESCPTDYVFLEVNKSFEKFTGLKREDIIGKGIMEIVPGIRDVKPDLIRLYGDVALTGKDARFEFYFEPFKKWYSVSAYCPEKNYFVSIFDDITEEKLLEKSLIEVEERERRRIGHDLHDGLGQLLTGLAFKVHGLRRMLEEKSSAEAEAASDISLLIDEAKGQVSALAKGLSPVQMDEEGLGFAFKELSLYINGMFGIPCSFKGEDAVAVNNETVLMQLYRITQEAVTNAAKHASPGHIEIGLTREEGKIIVTVKDDGTGIPDPVENKGGMGMKIMKYRASIINASLEIRKGIDKGTVVTCSLPETSEEM